MPTFTYLCEACGQKESLVHTLSDRPESCSHCGSNQLSRLMKGNGFHISGPGVYKEGYSGGAEHKPTKDGKIFTGEDT